MRRRPLITLLEPEELARIHNETLAVLERTGVDVTLGRAIDLFRKGGANVDGSRVRIPAAMVEKALETAPASFTLHARNPERSVLIGESQSRTLVEPSNGTVYVQDLKHGRRPGTLRDLADFIRLAQASPVCDINGGIPVEPSDVDPAAAPLRIFLETLRHTDKPLRSNEATPDQIRTQFAMLETAAGRPGMIEAGPCVYVSINPLSPLAFDAAPLETLITYAEHGQPTAVLSCALAGISAPISLLGVSVLQNAEILAGLVLTQLVRPGAPFIYAPASAVPDLRSGRYVTGSPESSLINLANLQLARDLYRLPTRTMAGLTDAKAPDAQAGFETMQNLMAAMAGGADIINECLGVLDSIMTNSFEKFVLDEEMIARARRFTQGLEASRETLFAECIGEVGPRGSYLYRPETLKSCRSTWRPTVSSWESHDRWTASGSIDLERKAARQVEEILASCPDSLIEPDLERELARMAGDHNH